MRSFLSLICGLLFFLPNTFSQTGTAGDPFTAFEQTANISASGTYFFNLSGNSFSTFIDDQGYVLLITDFGNGSGSIPSTSSLTASSRGILSPSILASLMNIAEIRISSSTGNIDVTTFNSGIINRVNNNQTLHRGPGDNTINNDWTGTNANRFTANASCNSPQGTTLNNNIFHPCGNAGTFHWMPNGGYQRELWTSGEISAGSALFMWAKAIDLLPVELSEFNVFANSNDHVEINWTTASEINNDYFVVERSSNLQNWEPIETIEGAGTTNEAMHYHVTDRSPFMGISYYRLMQVDFDGTYTYSEVKAVELNSSQIRLAPNPTSDILTISGNEVSKSSVFLYSVSGQKLSLDRFITGQNDHIIMLNVASLKSGIYLLKIGSKTHSFVKQ